MSLILFCDGFAVRLTCDNKICLHLSDNFVNSDRYGELRKLVTEKRISDGSMCTRFNGSRVEEFFGFPFKWTCYHSFNKVAFIKMLPCFRGI